MDELLQEFIAETRETLDALSGEVVAWEADPTDRARLDSIFRFVHTVKGSCGFLDLPRLARLSHAAEDVLAAVRDGGRIPDTALVNAVLAIIDRIGELVEAIDAGVSLEDSSEDLLIAALAENAAPVAVTATAPQARSHSRSVRLGVDLLDRMMSGMSEMVLARNDLARRLREGDCDPRMEAALERLSLTVADMRETVTRTRMQTIDTLFSAVPRLVRDTAAELGKTVVLSIEGGDVELDREMIELMRDPLVHVIRNSIDHGIEAPADRAAAGKPMAGLMTVSARQSGNQILIDITDDGRGIDTDRLVAKARDQRLMPEEALRALSEDARCELVFHPGLSSRDTVTATSGRGVGMDIVRANVEHIGGRVILSNRPGKGLAVTLRVPLTLSILTTIIVAAGGQQFALARQSVDEIVKVRSNQVRIDRIGGVTMATVRGERLPVVGLSELLGLGVAAIDTLVLVSTRDGSYALAVDEVIDSEELVIKPAAPAVMATGVYAGQTLPDNGRPMLLLDGAGVATRAGLVFDRIAAIAPDETEAAADEKRGLLFDDLDGHRRVVPLAVIDRVETVPVAAIRFTAGRLRLASGDALVPVHATAAMAPDTTVSLLRLTDGAVDIAYAIGDAIEIVALPRDIAPAQGAGVIAGVVMIADEQVEVIDVHALFAATAGPSSGAQPLCLLHADAGGWMTNFLKPVIEASGYRCVTRLAPGETAAVALAMSDGGADRTGSAAPLVTLRAEREPTGPRDESIYRYDREALQAALMRSREAMV
ncbi:chemotaxis protein CheA [Sphingomonas oligophenolica]|uniref:Chemotaxis protein CheA n=1 Tax=Sphingomonas oligophenolica TaxID=301154 RepID=A0A502CHD6_9SPHN|nr:chemotaxis protein CheW [Sphingomonas oligophenolica]TPG12122.1 chemotaxis protein CheA [Sphingomonas oligophenolica]